MDITPQRRAHLVRAGRIGGLTAALTVNTVERAQRAQLGLKLSFNSGHHCALCKPFVNSGQDEAERTRLAATAFRLHLSRIAMAKHNRKLGTP